MSKRMLTCLIVTVLLLSPVTFGDIVKGRSPLWTTSTLSIGWANLQWPSKATCNMGGNINIYSQIWIDGVTPGPGAGAGISAWIGLSPTNTNPNTWTNWVPAAYNADIGNNDEFIATIGSNLSPGVYYYASRFQINIGDYVFGGYSTNGGGFWDGQNNVSGILTVCENSMNLYILALSPEPVFSPVLEKDKLYKINVKGTYSFWQDNNGFGVDCRYFYDVPGDSANNQSPSLGNYDAGLVINNEFMSTVPNRYNSNHEYNYYLMGTGTSIPLVIRDYFNGNPAYSDNSGFLEVNINATPHLTLNRGRVLEDTTISSLYGNIEGTTFSPLPKANILIQTNNGDLECTDSEGFYSFILQANSLYDLRVKPSSGYLEYGINSINSQSGEVRLPDIYLTSLGDSTSLDYDLIELYPNPNPLISEIQAQGTMIRYYQIVERETRLPVNGIEVEFIVEITPIKSKKFVSKLFGDQNGIVVVEIDQQEDIGCPFCATWWVLNGIGGKKITNSNLEFRVDVKRREWEKEFRIERNMDVGIGMAIGSHFTAKMGDEIIASYTLSNILGESEPQKLGITMDSEKWSGIKVGTGGGTKFEVGPVTVGNFVNVEGGAYLTLGSQEKYKYNYNSYVNEEETKAKFLNLCLASRDIIRNMHLLPHLTNILSSGISSWNYLESVSGGAGVRGKGEAEAKVGISTLRETSIELGARLSGSAEIGGKLEYIYDKTNNKHYGSLKLFDKVSLSGGIGFLTWNDSKLKGINNIREQARLGYTRDIVDWERSFGIKYGGDIPNAPEIFVESTVGKLDWERTFRVNYKHNLNSMLGTSMLQNIVSLANPNEQFQKSGKIESGFINKVTDNLLSNIANRQLIGSYPPLIYEIDSSKISNGPGFTIDLDNKIGLSFEFGIELSWQTISKALIEKGVFLGGIDYPLEKYGSIPENNLTLSSVIEKIASEGYKKLRFWDYLHLAFIPRWKKGLNPSGVNLKNTQIVELADNGTTLEIDLSSIPNNVDSLSCYSWNWYGNSPTASINDLDENARQLVLEIKMKQQALAGLEYGIGGFYKFSPQPVGLSIPAILTIVYPDSDIVGIDESNLAIFYQDTTSSSWKYLGGVVNADSNKIAVNVDTLQLFTIAPIMPDGGINLFSNKDTLIYSENSTVNIVSDTLKLSDSRNVPEGVLYTITLENLEIVSADEDTTIAGIQIPSQNSLLSFQVKGIKNSGIGKIFAWSVNGTSKGEIEITVIDTSSPLPLVIAVGNSFDNGASIRVTNPDSNDIVQYEVYYGLVSGVPYSGTGLAGNNNSPFIVSALDSTIINGLMNDTTYYIAIKSVNKSGNRSEFSNEITITPIDTIAPGVIDELDFTLMPDSSYVVRWVASGDNIKEGIAKKYHFKLSTQSVVDTIFWWQNSSLVGNVTSPNESGVYDYHILRGIDTTYYLGIQVEDEVGLKSGISIYQIKPDRATRNLQIDQGWNLVSYPVKQNANSMKNILPSIDAGPYIFDMSSGYTLKDTLEEKQGCWIRVSGGYEMNLNGKIIQDTLIAVKTGWNLIGGNSTITNTENIYSQPAGIITSAFWGFDSTGYYFSPEIKYGKGYWIRVSQNGYIVLSQVSDLNKSGERASDLELAFELTSNTKKRPLYLTGIKDINKYQSPPPSPSANFDAKYEGDFYAESKEKTSYRVVLSNAQFPVMIKSKSSDIKYDVVGLGTNINYGRLTGENVLRIDDEKDTRIVLSRVEIPVDYYLNQNYPNPFNPTTTIKFGLPVDQKVKLVVFDILGQEVERIVNDEFLKAGNHAVEWNAMRYASGVYLLNIQAGNFRSIKKMMLIK